MQSYIEDKKFESKGTLLVFLKRIFSYAFRYKKMIWSFIGMIILLGISDAIWPLIWKYYLDTVVVPGVDVFQKNGFENFSMWGYDSLWIFGGIFLANGILQVIIVYGFIICAGYIQENVLYDLRKEMFDKLQRLSFSYYDKSQTGWLLSRVTSDSDRVCELISWGFLELLWGITMIISCLTIVFIYQWKLAVFIAVSIPLLIVVSFKIRELILKYSRSARKTNSEIIANFTENINGVEVNKLTAQESRISGEFQNLSDKMRRFSFKASFYTAMYIPIIIFIGSVVAMLILYFGGQMATATTPIISIGILAAFFGYATRIFIPIMDIARFYSLAQHSLSAGERIFNLIDEEPSIFNQKNASNFNQIKGDIYFKNVDFYYHPDKPVLQNFNLKIKAGQSIALVGPTGEGKSTIVNLVARFYEPKGGEILIDGEDYKNKTIESLRSQMGIVLQTPHLFPGTVRENVKYAAQSATETEIIEALKLVGGEELVARLDEEVGEGGEQLSNGERQIVSFARAVINNPAIFIMDEATSSIDAIAEAKIQKGIENLLKGRTSFVIAHRLSTIKNCDRILVINKGKIIEDGNHEQLIEKEGKYYDLYTRQIREMVG